ncbi:hypothetical protein J3Q64DRAFT_1827052 [Phycomyces blakesleeanus]|uniref:Copper fist DNA-binding transcription factor n=1 Tax=Phycomyces blakesleeanus TaxID=4837 RepID=A0ABR3BBQ3_PHYBL
MALQCEGKKTRLSHKHNTEKCSCSRKQRHPDNANSRTKIRNPTMVEIVMKNEQETLKYVNGGIKFEDKNAYGFPSFGSDVELPDVFPFKVSM